MNVSVGCRCSLLQRNNKSEYWYPTLFTSLVVRFGPGGGGLFWVLPDSDGLSYRKGEITWICCLTNSLSSFHACTSSLPYVFLELHLHWKNLPGKPLISSAPSSWSKSSIFHNIFKVTIKFIIAAWMLVLGVIALFYKRNNITEYWYPALFNSLGVRFHPSGGGLFWVLPDSNGLSYWKGDITWICCLTNALSSFHACTSSLPYVFLRSSNVHACLYIFNSILHMGDNQRVQFYLDAFTTLKV